jgi:hypothetical protein
MACPHGCAPARYLTISELEQLLRLTDEVSQALFPKQGTCSFHAGEVIVQAQEAAAAQLCQDLWGVA